MHTRNWYSPCVFLASLLILWGFTCVYVFYRVAPLHFFALVWVSSALICVPPWLSQHIGVLQHPAVSLFQNTTDKAAGCSAESPHFPLQMLSCCMLICPLNTEIFLLIYCKKKKKKVIIIFGLIDCSAAALLAATLQTPVPVLRQNPNTLWSSPTGAAEVVFGRGLRLGLLRAAAAGSCIVCWL